MVYELVYTEVFADWLMKLKNPIATKVIAKRLLRLSKGHLGDVKPVGDGVFELRIFTRPSYRIYFIIEQDRLVFLLCAGDKSMQSANIEKSKTMATELRSTDEINKI